MGKIGTMEAIRDFETKTKMIMEETHTDHRENPTSQNRVTSTRRITNQEDIIQETTRRTADTRTNHPQMSPAIVQENHRNLPTFLLTNIQSFGNSEKTSKITELEVILQLNKIDVAVLTETWLNEHTKDQILLNNYVSFHLVRKDTLRVSGGVTILVNDNIPTSKLDINVPEQIECIWISMRPKWLPRTVSNIIVAGVYYPGSNSTYAPNQEDLEQHITETVHQLCRKYANPLFVLMGDFNDLCVDDICTTCKLNQIVKIPTRKNATLDLILTNINNKLYKNPISLPNIGNSDHLCVLYEPIITKNTHATNYKTTIRKFHNSAMIEFGSWITRFNWNILLMINDVNLKVKYFFEIMWFMIDKFFPPIQVVMSSNDKVWITPKIKYLIAERQRAHLSKNIEAKELLAKKVKKEIKMAKIRYNKSKSDFLLNSNSKEWYQHISKIINNGKKQTLYFIIFQS